MMKTRTEAKRQSILDEATQVFRELGYEGTSMAEICARVGGSKATLYSHFASKDELFFAVMSRLCEQEFAEVLKLVEPSMLDQDDIAAALNQFGQRFLRFIYSPDVQSNQRLAIAGSGRNALGDLIYQRGILRVQQLISSFLQRAMEKGLLRRADPHITGLHLNALLQAELTDRFLFRQQESVSEEEVRQVTARAVEVFMAAYLPR